MYDFFNSKNLKEPDNRNNCIIMQVELNPPSEITGENCKLVMIGSLLMKNLKCYVLHATGFSNKGI